MPKKLIDTTSRPFKLIENYIYLYHTKTFIVIPVYPETISDSMGATFNQSTPLTRSAPIFSYSHSGPRTVRLDFTLHRDMMQEVNYGRSNAILEYNDDYIDLLVRQLQGMILPRYDASVKLVDPPLIAVRFGNELFIKGVVTGQLGLSYEIPILKNNKYAQVKISFDISEVQPYTAEQAMAAGSFRGLSPSLERNIWKR